MSEPEVVVAFSGGAASYNAARRIIEERGGPDGVVLLFNDVKQEDQSTYLAVRNGAAHLGCELFWVFCERKTHAPTYRSIDGLSVWDLFHEQRMMGKPGAGLCSRILKRETARAWVRQNAPAATVVLGMTWEERHRMQPSEKYPNGFPVDFWAPNPVRFPMAEEPWVTKQQMIDQVATDLGKAPDLYGLGGFEHSNCAGACVKAGRSGWRRLAQVRPAIYQAWEDAEQGFRDYVGKDVAILRDRRGGDVKPFTLRALRELGFQLDLFDDDGAGCGCFTADD